MSTSVLEMQQIPIEPPNPELYIPTLDSINHFAEEKISESFYEAATSVIVSCVQMIPVKDDDHPYHNRIHTLDVIEGYLEIAALALDDDTITPREMVLGLIACAAHDVEYDKADRPKNAEDTDNLGKNEDRSIKIVQAEMDKFDVFTEEDKEIVSECVRATIFEGVGDAGEILQRSSILTIAQYVVDGDLYNLAMKIKRAKDRHARYMCELGNRFFRPGTIKLTEEFIEFEIRTLKAHVFKTKHARLVWGESDSDSAGIKANIAYLESLRDKEIN